MRPLEILSDVHDSDVMIAISLPPYRRCTVDILTALSSASAKGAQLSGHPKRPLM